MYLTKFRFFSNQEWVPMTSNQDSIMDNEIISITGSENETEENEHYDENNFLHAEDDENIDNIVVSI